MSSKKLQFAILCNPENRRCQFYIDAVLSMGFRKPIIISYLELLQNKIDLFDIFRKVDVLKIDSFGENFEVRKHLLTLAAPLQENFISAKQALNLPFDKGRIQHSQQQYLGFKTLLKKVSIALASNPQVQVMNAIEDILLMFNKSACHQYLTQKNLPTIPAIYNIHGFDDLMGELSMAKVSRVFVKPNFGSSASGVIALRTSGDKIQATTSVELVESAGQIKLYNSLKVRTYTDKKQIKKIIDTLASDGLLVEHWIPKASTPKGVYDFRVVTTNQKPLHTIIRQSQSPLTNLHLGNQRGNLENIQSEIGQKAWNKIQDLAEQTAQAFPNSLYIGLDLLLTLNETKNYIIEANAFGDLLPNLTINGLDTYQSQIQYFKLSQNG